MSAIIAIAYNTFKEAIRNRILYVIVIFALIILGSSGILSDLTITGEEKIIKDLGLASINFFGLLIAVFVGIGLVYNEMDKKTIYTIISKPIDRYQFILGKFLGLLLTIYVIQLFMTLFFLFVLYFQQFTSSEAMEKIVWRFVDDKWVKVSFFTYALYLIKSFFIAVARAIATLLQLYHSPLTAKLMATIGLGCLELAIITAFAVFYSTVTSPTLSAIFTVLTFIIGRLNEDIIRYAWRMQEKGMTAALGGKLKYLLVYGIAHITPNLELFNKRFEAIYSQAISVDLYTIVYGVVYSAMIVVLASLAFRRKDFK